MTVTGRACTKCGAYKPAAAFKTNTMLRCGLNSWCKTCERAATRKWREDHKHGERADREIKATYGDPVAFSRHKCLHVADYVRNAINRFESKTGKEAPPHLTAILQLATSLAEQHPESKRTRKPNFCVQCDKHFHGRKDKRYCSPECRLHAKYLRKKGAA